MLLTHNGTSPDTTIAFMSTLAASTLVVACLYFLALFGLAHLGDRFASRRSLPGTLRQWILGLALGVYCSTWTVFGAIGTATRDGLGYLPIYLGPLLLLMFAPTAWERMVALQQRHQIGTLADFLGARFGRDPLIAALAAMLCLLAVVPYVALQLRALNGSFATLGVPAAESLTMVLLAMIVVFTLLFGVRDASAVQRRPGLVLVVAVESVLKLAILIAIALWAALAPAERTGLHLPAPSPTTFAFQTILAALAVLLLPRMFHIGVVECQRPADVRGARRIFAGYLIVVSLAVLPIAHLAMAQSASGDFLLISLPLGHGLEVLAILAFVAGLSAASAMIIVSLLALSTLVSNSLSTPLLLRLGWPASARAVLLHRRAAVIAVALVSLLWFRADAGKSTLAQMGLLAFAAVAQLAPILWAGINGDRTRALGARMALGVGACGWVFALWLPELMEPGARSQAELAWRAIVVLALNVAVLMLAQLWPAPLRERSAASAFLHTGELADSVTRVPLDDVRVLLDRILGPTTSVATLGERRDGYASSAQLQAAERALSAVLGNSAREVLTHTLGGHTAGVNAMLDALDQSARRVRSTESLLKATFEHMHQAVSVVDADLKLVAWNAPYERLFQWPADLLQVGRPIADLLKVAADQSGLDPDAAEKRTARRLHLLRLATPYRSLRHLPDGRWLDVRGEPLPGGGFVTTFFDVTESVQQRQDLEEANVLLEKRVAERTRQLAQAFDEKSRFIAAASHDLLQPLSAARLYLSAARDSDDSPLLARIDAALCASEDLLGGLTDLSRLDTGQLRPNIEAVALGPLFAALIEQYTPVADSRGLRLRYVDCQFSVQTDARLLRRILSNFLANAVRYTAHGGVLLGARRRGGLAHIVVIDTGPGIDADQAQGIFDDRCIGGISPWGERGLGLGLAGCRRLAQVMQTTLDLKSTPGHGSAFSLSLPISAPRVDIAVDVASEQPSLSLLVLDNDPEVLASLCTLLRGWRMQVHPAANCTAASAILASEKIDWAIVDYALGEPITGLDWIAAERAQWPGLRAALLTAEGDPDLPLRCKALGVQFLRKPVRPAALRATLSAARD